MSEYERQDPEEIEREIGQTRNRLSRDIDELGNKLSPQNLKEEAKSAIKGAAQGAASNVGEQARRTGSRLVEVIRENPLPVIAVGAGVTWLLTSALTVRCRAAGWPATPIPDPSGAREIAGRAVAGSGAGLVVQ